MEYLIREYIKLTYTFTGNCHMSVNEGASSSKTYHEWIINDLVKLFKIDSYTAETYLITHVLHNNINFGYSHFKNIKPSELPEFGLYYYMDFVYDSDGDTHADRFIGGIDPATGIDSTVYVNILNH